MQSAESDRDPINIVFLTFYIHLRILLQQQETVSLSTIHSTSMTLITVRVMTTSSGKTGTCRECGQSEQ